MPTIGEQLKAAREAKGVSLAEASKATRTLTKLIVAMETDNFSELPVPTYAKGFIRLYARYLDLDPEPLVEEYMKKHNIKRKPLLNEENRLEKNNPPAPSLSSKFKISPDLKPFHEIKKRIVDNKAPASEAPPPAGPPKDIRVIVAIVSGAIILILLLVSIGNCSRRHAAATNPANPDIAPAKSLLDGPAPDLYLVEPGQIEMN